jgi:hypothetical protein
VAAMEEMAETKTIAKASLGARMIFRPMLPLCMFLTYADVNIE